MPLIRYIVGTSIQYGGVEVEYFDADLDEIVKEGCMALGVEVERIELCSVGEEFLAQYLYSPFNRKACIVYVTEMSDSMRQTCKVILGTELVLFFKRGMLLIRPTTTQALVEAFIKRIKEGRSSITTGVLEHPTVRTENEVIKAGRDDNVDVRLVSLDGTRDGEVECARLIREWDTPLNRRPGHMEPAYLVRAFDMSVGMHQVLGIQAAGGGTHVLFMKKAWIYLGAIDPYNTSACFISDVKAGEFDVLEGFALDKLYPPEAPGPAGRSLESAACNDGLEGSSAHTTIHAPEAPAAPAARARKTCAVCGKTAAEAGIRKLLHCSGCTVKPRYCSEECQRHAWKHGGHKPECKANRR